MKKGLVKSGFFWLFAFVAFIGIMFWINGGTGTAESTSISSTEFVEYLEDNRVEKFSIRPNNNIYEIEGKLRQGAEIEAKDDSTFSIIGD